MTSRSTLSFGALLLLAVGCQATGGEEPAPAPEVGGQRILGQVLGGEEVFVFLELDDPEALKADRQSGVKPDPSQTFWTEARLSRDLAARGPLR